VRDVAPGGRDQVVVYIENGGDFVIPVDAVQTVHEAKVILGRSRLDQQVLDAIAHAHDQEMPGL